MFEDLAPQDIRNALLMVRQQDERTIVLLEGVGDVDALMAHIDAQSARCHLVGNKQRVLESMRLVNEHPVDGVLAIVDRDFDGIVGPLTSEPNVMYTDDADMDSTILFAGSVLRRIVQAHTKDEVRASDLAVDETVEDRLIALCFPIGVLRKLSIENGYELRLRRVPVKSVVAADGTTIDAAKLCDAATTASPGHAAPSDLAARHAAEVVKLTDARPLCRGHDLASVLAYSIKRWGGRKQMAREAVEALARSSFADSDLASTRLYAEVDKWCSKHGRQVWV